MWQSKAPADARSPSADDMMLPVMLRQSTPRSLIELLPYDVLEHLCFWVLRAQTWLSESREALLRFAIASPAFFAPAIHVAVRDRLRTAEPIALVQLDAWQDVGYNLPKPGQYVALLGDNATLRSLFLVLPSRHDRTHDLVPASDNGDCLLSLRFWSTIFVPLHQLAHGQIRVRDLAIVPVPPACRYLALLGDDRGPWPDCPSSVHSLSLNDCCLSRDQLSMVSSKFPTLRELTLRSASFNSQIMMELCDFLPSTLAVLKIESLHFEPEPLSEQCGAALSRALAQLMHLTVLHHELLFRVTDVVQVVNGLALAQAAGKRLLRSLLLSVFADLSNPVDDVSLLRQARDLPVQDLSLNVPDVYLGVGTDSTEYATFVLDLLGVVPVPQRSLFANLPAWPDRVVARVMPRFASPTLQSIDIYGTVPYPATKADFDESLLNETFRLSSLGRLDLHFPSLTSLTIMWCLPSRIVATDVSLTMPMWSLPPSLRSLNLSHNKLTMRDLDVLWPQLPAGLRKLSLDTNKLEALPASFPPSLHVLVAANNSMLGNATRWIEALPATLRELNVNECNLDDDAGLHLLAMRQRAGTWRATGLPRLMVYTKCKRMSVKVHQALTALHL
ncbi:hypothetical protein AMAG_10643 [Allomyces macrogynus ATCC 38327]|uniref:Uncharacterized protein n=1 Tax=Allomyces macrogynus (strain ATCC 38327) TaxID=578462 RepID=A0A0L0SR56_ALLM3|nr:hypothetical protein AMAG_10643 [Allomyces macrogynus ATCC 38327]|eukprot:KNE64976.1 hypothetical protein AMAG_10643 [Allomyces macrogynus ATCC 38327]